MPASTAAMGSGAGSLVLTIRRTRSAQIDAVDRIVPENYLLLPRSGPSGRPGCVRFPARGDHETTLLHYRCPPGGALDGSALSATAHRHDPRTRHRRRDAATAFRGHRLGQGSRRADSSRRALLHERGARGKRFAARADDRVCAGGAVRYGERRAGEITGSVTQVNSAQFNTGTIVSPQQLIENKVAGVEVVDNNEPGGGLSIRVRGQASVNAGSEPLYVVDGVPLGTGSGGGLSVGRDPLNFLNPNDIGSMTVLKDASAAALYGANASNGVVLITTKSGQGGPRVEYSASMSAAHVTRFSAMLNGPQFAAAVQAHASQFDTLLRNQNTDWFGLVSRTGWGQEHNLVLSGAGASNNYRLSVGYLNQDGILKSTTAERISLGLNYSQQLYDNRLNLHANLKGTRTYDRFTPNGVLYNAAQMGPTQPILDSASATGYYNWPGNSLTSADNPVEVLNFATDHGTTYRSVGNVQAKYDLSRFTHVEGLSGTVNLGYDVTQADRVTFYPNNIHFETKQPDRGSYNRTTPTQANSSLDAYLDYAPPVDLGPGHVDLTGGYSYSKSHGDYPGIRVTQFTSNDLADNGIPSDGLAAPYLPNVQDSRLISFFGRADYNVNDRYLISVSMRRDGSSRFGPDNQWGNFPAVSVGWRASREGFLQGLLWLTDLKLRASYGKTGNQ